MKRKIICYFYIHMYFWYNLEKILNWCTTSAQKLSTCTYKCRNTGTCIFHRHIMININSNKILVWFSENILHCRISSSKLNTKIRGGKKGKNHSCCLKELSIPAPDIIAYFRVLCSLLMFKGCFLFNYHHFIKFFMRKKLKYHFFNLSLKKSIFSKTRSLHFRFHANFRVRSGIRILRILVDGYWYSDPAETALFIDLFNCSKKQLIVNISRKFLYHSKGKECTYLWSKFHWKMLSNKETSDEKPLNLGGNWSSTSKSNSTN